MSVDEHAEISVPYEFRSEILEMVKLLEKKYSRAVDKRTEEGTDDIEIFCEITRIITEIYDKTCKDIVYIDGKTTTTVEAETVPNPMDRSTMDENTKENMNVYELVKNLLEQMLSFKKEITDSIRKMNQDINMLKNIDRSSGNSLCRKMS